MIDRNAPSSDNEPDGSWVWVGGALAAVFLILGLFAIFWGGHMPVNSAKPPAIERNTTFEAGKISIRPAMILNASHSGSRRPNSPQASGMVALSRRGRGGRMVTWARG